MNPSQNKAAMQDHIPQWQASNLTQAEYCKAHDIKPHIFSYYKKNFSSTTASVKQASQLVPVKLVTEGLLLIKCIWQQALPICVNPLMACP